MTTPQRLVLSNDLEIEYTAGDPERSQGRVLQKRSTNGDVDLECVGHFAVERPEAADGSRLWEVRFYANRGAFHDDSEASAAGRTLGAGLERAGLCGRPRRVFVVLGETACMIESLAATEAADAPAAANDDGGQSSPPPRSTQRCSFCDKHRAHVECLVAGPPGFFLCNECVALCAQIVASECGESFALGIHVVPATLRVRQLTPESPAARAGLQVGDVLDHDLADLKRRIREGQHPGKVTVRVRRGDSVQEIEILRVDPEKEWSV
ncbi:MAG: hypothetical protein JXQ29_02760 [Planctomycetes bacterium]|nr:hypothetical protein [Planctomycetota bacterium]